MRKVRYGNTQKPIRLFRPCGEWGPMRHLSPPGVYDASLRQSLIFQGVMAGGLRSASAEDKDTRHTSDEIAWGERNTRKRERESERGPECVGCPSVLDNTAPRNETEWNRAGQRKMAGKTEKSLGKKGATNIKPLSN